MPAPENAIALAVAQINGCDYCLAAHTYLGTHVAKLDEAEIAANRAGQSQTRRPRPPSALRSHS